MSSKKIGLKKTIKKNTKNLIKIPIKYDNKYDNEYDNEIFNSPIQFSKYNPYDIIQEDYKEYVKKNILETFIEDFKYFQYKYNIETISPYMSIRSWIFINNYIFRYMFTLSQMNNIDKMICEYGYSKGLLKLIDFYKYNMSSMTLKTNCEIIEYISLQTKTKNYADMTITILRDTIGFIPFNKLVI